MPVSCGALLSSQLQLACPKRMGLLPLAAQTNQQAPKQQHKTNSSPTSRRQKQGSNKAAQRAAGVRQQKQPRPLEDDQSAQLLPPVAAAIFQQQRDLHAAALQHQPKQAEYVAEPWEVAEPWDEPQLWQPQPGSALAADVRQEQGQWHQHQQQQQPPTPAVVQQPKVSLQQQLPASQVHWDDVHGDEDGGWCNDGANVDAAADGWLELDGSSEDDELEFLQTQQADGIQQQQQWSQLPQQQQHIAVPDQATSSNGSSDSGSGSNAAGNINDPTLELLQVSWQHALAAALPILATYDVRYDVHRLPRLNSSSRRGPGGRVQGAGLAEDEICLTAAAAAAARVKRQRRQQQGKHVNSAQKLQAVEDGSHSQSAASQFQQVLPAQQPSQQQGLVSIAQQPQLRQQQQDLLLPDEPRWQVMQRQHAAYLTYMRQLADMVVSRQQQGHQLVYQQVGICESWLQLSHILSVFGGPELRPAVVAAMWKRLAGIINRKVFIRMSNAERCHYDVFIEHLVQQSVISMSNGGGSSSSDDQRITPNQVAATAYGMAVLGVSDQELTAAVLQASGLWLQEAATALEQATRDSGPGVQYTAADKFLQQPGSGAASVAVAEGLAADAAAAGSSDIVEACGWSAADVASLLWGLGAAEVQPSLDWVWACTAVSQALMHRFQPTQLWGVLWGFAKMSHQPPQPWLASWLAAARQQLDSFSAEGLAHSIWALAALEHVPDRLWLRAFSGMVAYKVRSFMASELSMVLPGLSALGYKPRPEVCRTIIAQARRHLHTFKPSQLVAVLHAVASYPPANGAPASTSGWHPGRLFLFDFISQTSPPAAMGAWTGEQAAAVLWAFSRVRYIPDKRYLKSLLLHIQSQLPACGPDALTQALWGLAALQQQLPSRAWEQAWCRTALAVAGDFTPQALAHGLSAMAALRVQPPAELMQALTRAASGCLSSFTCMELGLMIAALADLHWRPSQAWMTAFVSQVASQLPAFENEDYGLLLFGLASLAEPLPPPLLGRLCAEAGRKLYGLSGEGLGLLVWGLAQYDYELGDGEDWWAAVYVECNSKWSSASLRGCGLMLVGLAQLGPRHLPSGDWESAYINRYKALTPNKPRSWHELLMGVRAAAGLEAGEPFPQSAWLHSMLLRLGRSWHMSEPDDDEAGGLAALIADINNQAAAASVAAVANDGDVRAGARPANTAAPAAAWGMATTVSRPQLHGLTSSHRSNGQHMLLQLEDYAGSAPTSATAVLL